MNAGGLEPPTFGLKDRCSTIELRKFLNNFSKLFIIMNPAGIEPAKTLYERDVIPI